MQSDFPGASLIQIGAFDMRIDSSRFGQIEIVEDDILRFPQGIIGMEDLSDWVLFADAENSALGWLQNVHQAEIALAVVSPRRFLRDYEARIARRQLSAIRLDQPQDAQLLVIAARDEESVTLNLKAPLVINLTRRLGCQVITRGDDELQHRLPRAILPLKKSA